MKILVTGGSGFIGRRLTDSLRAAGHTVITTSRVPAPGGQHIALDFSAEVDRKNLASQLAGIDVVVNAVGIIRERGAQTFRRIHEDGPKALFDACVIAGVERVIQISALGAASGTTRYFTSKRAADEYLMSLPLQWTIVQPALVYGPEGRSAAMFTALAALPLIPVPDRGEQQVQPVHVSDLIDAIVPIVERRLCMQQRVALAGPQPMSLKELLRVLRKNMQLPPAHFMPVPAPIMNAAARIARFIPGALLDEETLQMLRAGNVGNAEPLTTLIGRKPRSVSEFVTAQEAGCTSLRARLSWLLPLLRFAIASVWIWTAVVSLGLYPVNESYALLARVGAHGPLATVLLYAAALLDLLLGFAILLLRRRRWLWILQILVILGFTLIITIALPEYWLHPYGPVLKNLPMLAAIVLLYVLEPRGTQ